MKKLTIIVKGPTGGGKSTLLHTIEYFLRLHKNYEVIFCKDHQHTLIVRNTKEDKV